MEAKICDVVVDLRKDSETFGKWFGAELSEQNRTMMYVPKGFVHGFISLQPNSEILYLVSDFYALDTEGILIWNDKKVGIEWPIKGQVISEKDAKSEVLKKITPIKLKNS